MKVLVPKKSLAETVARVERIVPSRSSNPGLSLLRIDVAEDGLELSGSNMDVDIRARIAADAPGKGSYAVMGYVFSQVVRALPAEDVSLEFEDDEVQIRSGTYSTRLQVMAPDSAPLIAFTDEFAGTIDAELFARALTAVKYAAAVADFQAVFRGVKLEFSDARTRAVATDGFRLAYYDLPGGTGLATDVIVPARSVEELLRVLGDGPVQLALEPGQLSVRHANYALNLKLMDATFPDYERVIPKNFPVSITLKAGQLAETVARVALMADKTANNRVDLFTKGGELQITAEGSFGRSQESLTVMQAGTDPEIFLAYNSRYLIDALTPIAGDVRLAFSGANSAPSVVTAVSDPSYVAMVVPLRIS